eukprot:3362287-Amphidinium_carterae.1
MFTCVGDVQVCSTASQTHPEVAAEEKGKRPQRNRPVQQSTRGLQVGCAGCSLMEAHQATLQDLTPKR